MKEVKQETTVRTQEEWAAWVEGLHAHQHGARCDPPNEYRYELRKAWSDGWKYNNLWHCRLV